MNAGWLWGGRLSALLISVSSNPLLSGSYNFSVSLAFFVFFFVKFAKIWGGGVRDLCSGTGCKSVTGWREKCVAYSLFCIVSIIVIVSIIIIIII